MHSLTNSYGWSLIIFSLCIKLLLYYPTQQQYKSMKSMSLIQPEMKRIQEKYKEEPEKLQKAQMELFKEHNVNPLGGCLPMVAQLPILWGIYGAIRQIFSPTTAVLLAHGPVAPDLLVSVPAETFLWIGTPLSHQYSTILASSFQQPDALLVLFYAFSMWLSQKALTPTSVDPAQMQQQKMMQIFMPLMLTFTAWKYQWPCALVLYWLMFNMFNVLQQIHMTKSTPAPSPPSPS
jgi:YidC/Oxa1 family membrane protein insertase